MIRAETTGEGFTRCSWARQCRSLILALGLCVPATACSVCNLAVNSMGDALAPLVGLNLFFASYRFGKPVIEIFRAVLPQFVALGVGVLAITYLPLLSTGLPALAR
jgi:TRAP-type C4-dicarboxylate transport system permease large subunit